MTSNNTTLFLSLSHVRAHTAVHLVSRLMKSIHLNAGLTLALPTFHTVTSSPDTLHWNTTNTAQQGKFWCYTCGISLKLTESVQFISLSSLQSVHSLCRGVKNEKLLNVIHAKIFFTASVAKELWNSEYLLTLVTTKHKVTNKKNGQGVPNILFTHSSCLKCYSPSQV